VLGDILVRMGRGSEAVRHYQLAISAADRLPNTDPDIGRWIAGAHWARGGAEELIAKRSPVASPARLTHHKAACASYRSAAEQYRENARRAKPTELEAKNLAGVVRALRSCPP